MKISVRHAKVNGKQLFISYITHMHDTEFRKFYRSKNKLLLEYLSMLKIIKSFLIKKITQKSDKIVNSFITDFGDIRSFISYLL